MRSVYRPRSRAGLCNFDNFITRGRDVRGPVRTTNFISLIHNKFLTLLFLIGHNSNDGGVCRIAVLPLGPRLTRVPTDIHTPSLASSNLEDKE
jgi:hypothetical protein